MLLPSTMMRASQLLAALLHDTPQYTDDLAFVTLYMSPDSTAALGRGSPRSAQAASAARAASSSSLYAPRYLKLAVREERVGGHSHLRPVVSNLCLPLVD